MCVPLGTPGDYEIAVIVPSGDECIFLNCEQAPPMTFEAGPGVTWENCRQSPNVNTWECSGCEWPGT